MIFLVVFAFLGMMGIGDTITWTSTGTLEGFNNANGYFDETDHMVAYGNGTPCDDYGTIHTIITPGTSGPWNRLLVWDNGTEYNVYTDTGERSFESNQVVEYNLGSSLGLIGIIAGGIILAGFIGTRILGSSIGGGNEESASAIWKGTILLTVWGIFSALAIGFITVIPLIGPFFYLFLTIIYCLGVINQIGNPGDD